VVVALRGSGQKSGIIGEYLVRDQERLRFRLSRVRLSCNTGGRATNFVLYTPYGGTTEVAKKSKSWSGTAYAAI
jgi:hypothetical protein